MEQDRTHPYRVGFLELGGCGSFVIVHRRDASTVTGTLVDLNDHGATISFQDPHQRIGTNVKLFVAYHDMRGVGTHIKLPQE